MNANKREERQDVWVQPALPSEQFDDGCSGLCRSNSLFAFFAFFVDWGPEIQADLQVTLTWAA
jgi:hypothetical protein